MARHLTAKDVDTFVNILDAWDGKLTWEALCEKGAALIGYKPTRQTLNAHEKIKFAYSARKAGLVKCKQHTQLPSSLTMASQRIRRLEAENERLRVENDRLIEQFVKWQYNAYKLGITKEQLEAALPFVDRDSSEKLAGIRK